MTIDKNEERNPIDLIVEEFALRVRQGDKPSIQEYVDRYPEHGELIRSMLPSIALMERISNRDTGSHVDSTNERNRSDVPHQIGDFKIVREIGRGGMGIVYEAVQTSLQRHVALKIINGFVSNQPQHQTRFRREAEASASLHHTNIVPIFGIGESSGYQYYAMQLIDGVTLHDIIQSLRLGSSATVASLSDSDISNTRTPTTKVSFSSREAAHRLLRRPNTESIGVSLPEATNPLIGTTIARDSRTLATAPTQTKIERDDGDFQTEQVHAPNTSHLSERPNVGASQCKLTGNYFRNVARLIANAANALDYAHHAGVLHRDIKPANLLLDRNSTVWITDFGLARRVDHDDLTQSGEILGTLRYMAPEQIRGKGDHRIDIFSLGLTLFELLTLTPAIQAPKARLLDPTQSTTIPDPRTIEPTIPLDLRTITQKACAFDPEHRYQRAKDLEQDLLRFLDDRPILARRTTAFETAIRWAKRNPAIATLLATVSVLLVSMSVLLAMWNEQSRIALSRIQKEYGRAEASVVEKAKALELKSAALDTVKKEHARAELNLNLALAAFDKIAENIASRGSTISIASELGEDTLDSFTEATLNRADVDLLMLLLEFFDQFSKENAKDLRIEVAQAHHRVADIQHKLGNLDDAEKMYLRSLAEFEAIRKRELNSRSPISDEFAIIQSMIVVHAKKGELPKAAPDFMRARKLIESSPEFKNSLDGKFAMAQLLNTMGTLGAKYGLDRRNRPSNLGSLNGRNRDIPPAIAPLQMTRLRHEAEQNHEALKLFEELVNAKPESLAFQIALARANKDQVRIDRLTNEVEHAERSISKAIDIMEKLTQSNPESTAYKYELSDILNTNVAHRPVDAERCHRALKLIDEILKQQPGVPEFRALKASILTKLAAMVVGTPNERFGKSNELLHDAADLQRDLADQYPEVAVYSISLIQIYVQLSQVNVGRRPDKAAEYLDLAIQRADNMSVSNNLKQVAHDMIDRLRNGRRLLENRSQENPR